LPPKIRTKVTVTTDSGLVRQICHILKKDLNDKHGRKQLVDAISKRNEKFTKSGELDSTGLLGEIKNDYACEMFGDPE